MQRRFTSDIHIGHRLAAEKRGFDSLEEHDVMVLDSLLPVKRSKTWILGDIAFSPESTERVAQFFKGTNTVFILGNHDKQGAKPYVDAGLVVMGPEKYNNFWLSHHPIHPQELYRVRGNVHGHIHANAATRSLPHPYFNVNWDFWRTGVDFDFILKTFDAVEADLQTLE
jgi:calcineurin-like phosphoesterase family protein